MISDCIFESGVDVVRVSRLSDEAESRKESLKRVSAVLASGLA
jgi:hypothetical protein